MSADQNQETKIFIFYTLEHQHPGNHGNAPLVDDGFAISAHEIAHVGKKHFFDIWLFTVLCLR
jgi:hypothetical protein